MYPPFLAGPIYNSTERDFNVASDSLVVFWLVSDLVFLQLFSKTGEQSKFSEDIYQTRRIL